MSKKNQKEKNEPPIDYQVSLKNLQFTITLREKDIEALQQELSKKNITIKKLYEENSELKKNMKNIYDVEIKYNKLLVQNEKMKKKEENFNVILNEKDKKFEEEKNKIVREFNSKINQLNINLASYEEKIKLTNQLIEENKKLNKELEEEKNKNNEINQQLNKNIQKIKLKNSIKFKNLKNYLNYNITKSKEKYTGFDLKFKDNFSKLSVMQNQEFLIELEILEQERQNLLLKNQKLEKKIYELKKDIEIHKKVELNLAEKNFGLTLKNKKDNINIFDMSKSSMNNNKEENKNLESKIYNKTISFNNNNKSIYNSNFNNDSTYNNFVSKDDSSKLLNLQTKIINLEHNLISCQKAFNELKDRNEYTKKILENYENKYSGLFKFFEESLSLFYQDENLKKDNNIFINIESIKNCDFSCLNNETKYSVLIILMKYLIPLVTTNLKEEIDNLNQINIRFHNDSEKLSKKNSYSLNKNKNNKKFVMNTVGNFYNKKEKDKEYFPSIKSFVLTNSNNINNLNKRDLLLHDNVFTKTFGNNKANKFQ